MAANSDMIIVNFEALDSAVDSFATSTSRITDIACRMRTNASAIQGAIVSDAASDYVSKANTYATNVDKAEELLDMRIQTLRSEAEKARAAESRARAIAGGVGTFSMQ